MYLSLGAVVRLFTRAMYIDIERRRTWNDPIKPSSQTLSELAFWKESLVSRNGKSFKFRPTTTKIVFTDASSIGYGGYICEKLDHKICHGKFSPHEMSLSSTARELLAVEKVLYSFGNILAGESVQINIDNQNTCRILTVGSSKEHLQKISLSVFDHCLKHEISLIPHWIPRDDNKIADCYSRINDTDDWSIDNKTFNYINDIFDH